MSKVGHEAEQSCLRRRPFDLLRVARHGRNLPPADKIFLQQVLKTRRLLSTCQIVNSTD